EVPVTLPEAFRWGSDPRLAVDHAPGGTLTEAFAATWPTITPFREFDDFGHRITERVVESLATRDPSTLEFRGLLADGWQSDPEGRWLRVHIRPGARFSDGASVTAADVRWTFHEFVLDMEVQAARARSVLSPIARIEVIDDATVEFRFHDATFLNLACALEMPVLPRHFYDRFTPEELNRSTGLLMGSGPYRLAVSPTATQW
ncbi:MAG: hypothetical protein KDA21_14945, partial [Phycisphaerales bacterium]|nr:hypothetical protein [Phycisphaerales bacterium]